MPAALQEVRRHGLRHELRAVVDLFDRHHLLMVASGISFQLLTAVVPVLLFVLGMLGFLDLTEIWAQDVRPSVAESVSRPALQVIDSTVEQVLGGGRVFWVTGGAALAAWQVSGAIRAAMDALNRVYGAEEDRPLLVRMRTSIALAVAELGLLLVALAVVVLAPLVDGDPGPVLGAALLVARWSVAALLVLVAVGLIVHQGPDRVQPVGWTSLGSVLVVVSWLSMTALFGLYVTRVADYASLFGNLATVVVLMAFVYASAIAFLAGIAVDGLLRDRGS